MTMQTQTLAIHASLKTATTPPPVVPIDISLTEHQIAELRETWLEHQIKPIGEHERRGVPYSALNE